MWSGNAPVALPMLAEIEVAGRITKPDRLPEQGSVVP